MNALVSVIVPVYNVEKYIEDCIKSILAQTYPFVEIVVVDDGSNDESLKILERLTAENGNKIKLVSVENGGVSRARNIALDMVEGKYIAFIDSDDYYFLDYIERALSAMQKNSSQMVIAPLNLKSEGKEERVSGYILTDKDVIETEEYVKIWLSCCDEAYWGGNCNKLYRADIIKENSLKFQEGISIGEDLYFNLSYLKFVDKISVLKEPTYNYRIDTAGSISKSKRDPKKYFEQYIKIYNSYSDLCKNKCAELPERELKRFLHTAVYRTLYMGRVTNCCGYKEFKKLFGFIREKGADLSENPLDNRRVATAISLLRREKALSTYIMFSLIKLRAGGRR